MSRPRGTLTRRRRWLVFAAALAGLCAIAALASSGVGSSGREQGDARSLASRAGAASRHLVAAAPDPVTESGGVTEISEAVHPTGPDNDEVSASGAGPIEACGLVARSAAVRILGHGVRAAERPQGPTCVYTGSGREITLALEEVPLPKLPAGARKAQRLHIAGRTAWCRRYESDSVVVVGLSGERVLRVTGPCQAGVRFAAQALRRI